mmetsp:Transcript_43891/g.139800  ORF Transcript_43891/g.139800 Transcript_43891/m.139800 type:complete len:387 (-) Transcript_43891:86-1246(-)
MTVDTGYLQVGPQEWTWRGFCGLNSYHMLPLASCFLMRILVGLRVLQGDNPALLSKVCDWSRYWITASGSAMGLVVLALSVRVFKSESLRKMLRDLGHDPLLKFKQILGPVARLASFCPVLYAIHWGIRVWSYADLGMVSHEGLPWWMRIMWAIGLGTTGFTIAYLMVVFLFTPWIAARSIIDKVIDKIDSAEKDLDWDMMLVEVHELDQQLEDMWSVGEVGSQWLLVMCIAFLALLYGAQGAFITDVTENPYPLVFVLAGGLTIAALLYALSTISTRCLASASSPRGARSILGSARRFLTKRAGAGRPMVQEMTEEQRSSHHRFVTFLAGTEMGAQVCGILVTQSWVLSMVANLGVALPILYRGLMVSVSQQKAEALMANATAMR